MQVSDGRQRLVIEDVSPQVDGGRFPIKRVVGESIPVRVDLLADGHDAVSGWLCFRHEKESGWQETPLVPVGNDRFQAEFRPSKEGRYYYTISAWIDHFGSWRRDLQKRHAARQELAVEFQIGRQLVAAARELVPDDLQHWLTAWLEGLANTADPEEQLRVALSDELAEFMARFPNRAHAVSLEQPLCVVVDRIRARFSTWYEMFPRSTASLPGQHGTFNDCLQQLPRLAEMGFDVWYMPPIHPIGVTYRKGPNNALEAGPQDPGCPWAIGSALGGHRTLHPQLGTLEDFRNLITAARRYQIEIAMDLAWQCAPDHPYVAEHPEWFKSRPDGTIQYAENPPKKYQDIYPFNFETPAWQAMWEELKEVVLFWCQQGVRIYRVDNPHTKPFGFWEWMIHQVKTVYPDALFLAEAFTRPKVMRRLAKLGFTQSYTYFTWRNTKEEITEYLTELSQGEAREYFRPNAWPNTPDILSEYLQYGGPPAFAIRLVLAATLCASYGIYGPAYEQCEHLAREHGSEEYLNSEKYEIRVWKTGQAGHLDGLVSRLNSCRRANVALQSDWGLRFHPVNNEQLICYSKQSPDKENLIVVVVNIDPRNTQVGWVELPLPELGIDPGHPYQMHDLLSDARYLWDGPKNYVSLDPLVAVAHVFLVRCRTHTEVEYEHFAKA